MADATKDPILRFIRQLSGKASADGVTDAELLCRFVTRHDEAAFELLLWRYASLVRHVCRNVTRDHHDAEDAFQATFLVLARKARSVRKCDALGAWLYRVAYRIALRARCQTVQRTAREKRGLDLRELPANDPTGETAKELQPLLIEEVNRLPVKYRTPVILCYLQGKTLDEAARFLGWPKGTVSGRLARARDMLRGRLVRRGLTTSVGAIIAALSPGEITAMTPVFRPVVRAALRFANHGFCSTAPIPQQSVLLAEGMLRTMYMTKLKAILAAVFTTVVLGSGVHLTASHVLSAKPATEPVPEQSAPPSSAEDPPEKVRPEAQKAVTAALERSYKSYMELRRTFWDPDEAIPLTAVVSPVPLDAEGITQPKGNWDKMAAATRKDRGYRIQVKVFRDGTKEVWHGSRPLDPEPLARLSRSLVSDGKTVQTFFDPDATVAFQIPAGSFPAGTYRVHLFFLDPDGVEHAFRNAGTVETARRLVVRPSRLNLKELLLPSRSVDDRELLTKVTEIANPGRRQFPKDDPNDCQARSVWCLERFQGRIYVGYGDWDRNRGPINVWSFGPESDPLKARFPSRYSFSAGTSPRLLFTHEYTVQEESIDRFRVLGDRLFIPGIDGNKENGPDGLVFSNLYIREGGSWRKLSTLPCGPHVMDVAELDKRLIVDVNGLQMSEDGGLRWKELAPGQPGGQEFVRFRDGLLIFGDGEGGAFYRKGKLETHLYDFFPGYGDGRGHRSKAFLDGVIYTAFHNWGMKQEVDRPLFYFRDFAKPSQIVELFRGKFVRDTLLEDGRLYVLTGLAEEKDFVGEIFATTNLCDWTRLAVVTTPAMPSAFCRLEERFYVGLANRGYDPLTYDEHKARRYAYADKISGSIWLLGR